MRLLKSVPVFRWALCPPYFAIHLEYLDRESENYNSHLHTFMISEILITLILVHGSPIDKYSNSNHYEECSDGHVPPSSVACYTLSQE